ncbi:MAG: efflux RND transporter periplasmic adaptor subunit [Candidatus Gastranaerophilales bacterium]|nr:efflux RND transporter periplasmic adaptor subunit [Candidatus Gastranaerophilales bacterium]
MKNKIILIVLIVLITVVMAAVIGFAVKKNKSMIIQGEVETKNVNLSSKVPGRIKTINVEKGDFVKKGDVLLILDTPEIEAKYGQADAAVELAKSKELEVFNGARAEQRAIALNALNKAKSDFMLAEKTYKRLKNLNNEGVISNQKADEAYTMYKNAEQGVLIAQNNYNMIENGARYEDKLMASANVKRAESSKQEVNSYLDENEIKSPINGQVTEIIGEEGEVTGAGYPIITVTDNEDNWIVFNLREDLLPKIKIGTEFDVEIPALKEKKIRVKVNYISVMGNFATWRATKIRGDFDLKTFEVHAKPIQKNTDLRAGMSVITDWNKIK